MRIPVLTELPSQKEMTEEFKGYNHNLRIGAGEWYEEKNMTTDYYPLASPRRKRSLQKNAESADIDINNTDYTAENTKGMVYTDGKLVSLQKLKKDGNTIGCWFVDNGELVVKKHTADWTVSEATGSVVSTSVQGTTLYYPKLTIKSQTDAKFLSSVASANIEFYSASGRTGEKKEYLFKDIEQTYESENQVYVIDCRYYYAYKGASGYNNALSKAQAMATEISGTYKYARNEDFVQSAAEISTIEAIAPTLNADTDKELVRMGSYAFAAPEGVVYETANTTDDIPVHKVAETVNYISGESLTAQTAVNVNDDSNFPYDNIQIHYPEYTGNTGYRYYNGTIQQYLENENMWVNQPTYVVLYKKNASGNFGNIKEGDSVFLTQTPNAAGVKGNLCNIFDKSIKVVKKGTLNAGDYLFSSTALTNDTDYIVVEGIAAIGVEGVDRTTAVMVPATLVKAIERKTPVIKFACESQNRIWACDNNGHEIYASALGNPYNFYDYSGLATDSYAVNVGTDGEWTGCVNYLGQPLFFKENAVHIISGSYPTNQGQLDGGSYAVTTITDFKGVEKGSDKSFAIIDNILYYKSAEGIVAYDGSATSIISTALGKTRYKNAVAGCRGNKYYVSMQDESNAWHIFVYDTKLGTWSNEDNTHAAQFLKVESELVYLDKSDDKVYSVSDTDALNLSEYEVEGVFNWMCETGTIGYSLPNNKYISRFQVRMQVEDGARVSIYTQYDSDGVWHKVGDIENKGVKTHLLPIVPRRCDHMKIKFEGKGDAKIISIAKIIEEGGDVV